MKDIAKRIILTITIVAAAGLNQVLNAKPTPITLPKSGVVTYDQSTGRLVIDWKTKSGSITRKDGSIIGVKAVWNGSSYTYYYTETTYLEDQSGSFVQEVDGQTITFTDQGNGWYKATWHYTPSK